MNFYLLFTIRNYVCESRVRPEKVAELTGLSQVSSYKLIDDFVRLGILREVTGGQRNRIFLFHEYFDVFNDRS
ncbi:MAG: hypothetical protein IPL74_17760 [Bacteroidetes bacterium]|nr:hypothetical protein [Bacteroidota bacterium]